MAEKLTEIELAGIQVDVTKPKTLVKDPDYNILQEDDIDTAVGVVHVAVQGNRSKPAIITYHDIGMNHITCFQGFFNYADMQPILRHFCVYHVNAPGQQEGALPLTHSMEGEAIQAQGDGQKKDEREVLLAEHSSESAKRNRTGYPSMDQLAEMLLPVLQYYGLKRVIGFGVGAGSNILCRFALQHPEKVDALFLVNCTSHAVGWSEWAWQKMNSFYLKMGNMTATTEDYLLWHWFGTEAKERNTDLYAVFKQNIKQINPYNLACFIDAYTQRTDLGIMRELDPAKKKEAKTLKELRCNVMLVAGAGSPHLDDMVNMNGRLDPTNSNFLKVSDCSGMVLEEQPHKVSEAFRLFLQGMGYVPSLSQTKIVAEREEARRNSTPFDSPARTSAAAAPARYEAGPTVC